MDVVYLSLIGVGVLSMAVALVLKAKPSTDASSVTSAHRTADKVEVERMLQQLGRQLKQDKDRMQTQLDQSQAELLAEVHELRQRIEQLENSRATKQVQQTAPRDAPAEPRDEDVLVLRERYRRAFELQREGLSLDEIAKRLGSGRGEIDLIFALAAKNERGIADA